MKLNEWRKMGSPAGCVNVALWVSTGNVDFSTLHLAEDSHNLPGDHFGLV